MKTNSSPTDDQIKDLIRDLISSKAMAQQMQQCPPPAFLEQKDLQIDALRELLEFREAKRRPFKSFCRGSFCNGHGDYAVCGSLYRGEYFQCSDCKVKDLESQHGSLAESVADLVISRLDERDVAKMKTSMMINDQFNEAMREIGGCVAEHSKTIAEPDRFPPAPVVPDIATVETTYPDVQTNWQDAKMYAEGWNACRASMLNGGKS